MNIDIKTIKICNLTITGYSVARERTMFYIQELKIYLDAGCYPLNTAKKNGIFISHGHLDHSKELKEFKMVGEPVNVYVPPNSKKYFENFINSANELNYLSEIKDPTFKHHNFIEFAPNDLSVKFKEYEVECIELYHSVSTNGYLFYRQSKDKKNPLFAYLLDTTTKVFEVNDLSHFPLIICECTFIDEKDMEQSIKTKHTHLDLLLPFIQKYDKTTFLLTHFSTRYTKDYIWNKLKSYSNVRFI